ncbi:MAG TPA: M28 family peptidase [Eubacteriales bacterium]|nr:M28 family peptidase [Eubacteriales bacterium]
MKKIICLFIVILISIAPMAVFADSSDQYSAYDFLNDFVTACPQRVSGSEGETLAAEYIKNKFIEMGYQTEWQEFNFTIDSGTINSQNVVARMFAQNSLGQIIIGAHYDSVNVGNGANDNGSGVAVLLDIAQKIADLSLNYDVVLVAFGAEEEGFYGSSHFVTNMSMTERQSTLLMINIDSVAVGDNLYFFGEDKATALNDSLVELANSFGYSQKAYAKPLSKDLNIIYASTDIPYYHTGYASDNSVFRIAGIPTEFVFSGTFENYDSYTQTADADFWNMHTANDTLLSVNSFGVKAKENMQIVSDTLSNFLTNDDFKDIIINARADMTNDIFWQTWPAYVIYGVLLLGFSIFGFLYLRKLRKLDLLTVNQKNEKKVFESASVEDIYDLK